MKRDEIFWNILTAIIMLLFPWIAVTFVKGDGGIAVCFILFYCVNPLYSVIAGAFAGRDHRRLWYLPLSSATLFLLGTWIFFDMGEKAFILYAVIYFIIGIFSTLISMFIKQRRKIK